MSHVCVYAVNKYMQIAQYEVCHYKYVGIPPMMYTI